MAYKAPLIAKVQYSIGEVAEMFGETTSSIRFWSNKFTSIIKPQKNKKGNRLFSVKDVESFKLIYHLVREKGMTLDGAKKRLEDNRSGDDHSLEVIERLNTIKTLLEEIQASL